MNLISCRKGPISESDFFTWEALIVGPKDTPFEGGVFPAILTFVRLSYVLPRLPYAQLVPTLFIARLLPYRNARFHFFCPLDVISPHAAARLSNLPSQPTRMDVHAHVYVRPAFGLPSISIQDEV